MRTTPKSQPWSPLAQPTGTAPNQVAVPQNPITSQTNRYRCLFSVPSASPEAHKARGKAPSLGGGTFRSHIQDVKKPSTLVLRTHSRLLRVRAETPRPAPVALTPLESALTKKPGE